MARRGARRRPPRSLVLPVHDADAGVNQPRARLRGSLRRGRRPRPRAEARSRSCGSATSSTTPARRTARSASRSGRCARSASTASRRVVISGNHDTPRLPGTGSPYSVLADTFPEIHFATRLQYERVRAARPRRPRACRRCSPSTPRSTALAEADSTAASTGPTCCSPTRACRRSSPSTPTSTRSRSTPARCGADLVLLGHYHLHHG